MTDPVPLPKPDFAAPTLYVYTADQMRAYGAAMRQQALEDAAQEVDKAIGEAIAGHFNKQAISALMQTRDMLKERALKNSTEETP